MSSFSGSSHKKTSPFSGLVEAARELRERPGAASILYHVFINHRGPDVKEILALPLYNSLQELGFQPFLDSKELELGDSIPSKIDNAIRSSWVHIAIFSKRYAESPWCLVELELIVKSKGKIIPIFYDVAPSDLRHVQKNKGAYADAFSKYKEQGRYLNKLEEWKESLHTVSFISGREFNTRNGSLAELRKDIAAAVINGMIELLEAKPLHVAKQSMKESDADPRDGVLPYRHPQQSMIKTKPLHDAGKQSMIKTKPLHAGKQSMIKTKPLPVVKQPPDASEEDDSSDEDDFSDEDDSSDEDDFSDEDDSSDEDLNGFLPKQYSIKTKPLHVYGKQSMIKTKPLHAGKQSMIKTKPLPIVKQPPDFSDEDDYSDGYLNGLHPKQSSIKMRPLHIYGKRSSVESKSLPVGKQPPDFSDDDHHSNGYTYEPGDTYKPPRRATYKSGYPDRKQSIIKSRPLHAYVNVCMIKTNSLRGEKQPLYSSDDDDHSEGDTYRPEHPVSP